jgi:hypothetical protein
MPGLVTARPPQQPGRLVADAAAGVTAILDHLGAGSFVTAGWSGGRPARTGLCGAAARALPGRNVGRRDSAARQRWAGLARQGPENVQEFTAAGVPITIWRGGQDRMVPFAHGAWLAGQLPGARVHLLPGEGRLTLAATAFSQILADLLDLAGVRPAGAGGQPG